MNEIISTTLKWEPDSYVKNCTLCKLEYKDGDEFCFLIVKTVKFPTTQSLEVTVKTAHKNCVVNCGCKLAGAAGHMWVLP